MTQAFIAHRKEVLAKFGAKLFAEESVKERRARMKFIINAWDMDGGEDVWIKQYGNPHGRTLRGAEEVLEDGTVFKMDAYRVEAAEATAWMADRVPSAVEFIRERMVGSGAGRRQGGRRRRPPDPSCLLYTSPSPRD